MTERTAIQEAFRETCEAEARLYMIKLSGRGDKSAAFHAFAGAFRNLYSLTINNTKIREAKTQQCDTGTLVEHIDVWFERGSTSTGGVALGTALFKEFNIALGGVGLL
ncbi:MAG: hypothetical protein BA864_14390 [Desulfuromonadales bacterium C00003093]|nr:MAG: hypothetical protein BA864_14390 [Desulfuromonadales bacterium C00003093]